MRLGKGSCVGEGAPLSCKAGEGLLERGRGWGQERGTRCPDYRHALGKITGDGKESTQSLSVWMLMVSKWLHAPRKTNTLRDSGSLPEGHSLWRRRSTYPEWLEGTGNQRVAGLGSYSWNSVPEPRTVVESLGLVT